MFSRPPVDGDICCATGFSDSSGSFHTPRYPTYYSNNVQCEVTYTFDTSQFPSGQSKTVYVYVNGFSTEKNYDYFIVEDGQGTHRFSGNGADSANMLNGRTYWCMYS